MHALEHRRPDRAVTWLVSSNVSRIPRTLESHPILLTVLAALGALTGLAIAALLARDPREAGAYAVACVMIGGAMAMGQRARPDLDADRAREQRAAADARATQAAQDELRSVTHDLRAPLLTVSSYLDLIAQGAFGPVSDEARAAVRHCASVAGRAQDVVEATLRPSRLDAAGEDPQPAAPLPVDLARVCADVLEALDANMRDRRAQVEMPRPLPPVGGDETALFRVFENLLQNSIKYARPDVPPRIQVSWQRVHGGAVQVSVLDNGIGIAAHERTAVLGLGVRGAAGQGPGESGLGLGLATATRLVTRMGGTLTIDPRSGGQGALVRVTLPGC